MARIEQFTPVFIDLSQTHTMLKQIQFTPFHLQNVKKIHCCYDVTYQLIRLVHIPQNLQVETRIVTKQLLDLHSLYTSLCLLNTNPSDINIPIRATSGLSDA